MHSVTAMSNDVEFIFKNLPAKSLFIASLYSEQHHGCYVSGDINTLILHFHIGKSKRIEEQSFSLNFDCYGYHLFFYLP